MRMSLLSFVLVGGFFATGVECHGRLIEPPSRASMWRYGFDTPHDYNDHECYCGGFSRQWQRNKGKCGICGDPWDAAEVNNLMTPSTGCVPQCMEDNEIIDCRQPRAHETGGKYGNSIIVRRYRTGSVIPVRVELTANHYGYFEFRTCAMTVRGREVTDDCLDKHLLKGVNGSVRYYPGPGAKIFEAYYRLPEDLTCAQCVFQWRYIAGNNWGKCSNGTGAVGCGPQEEFRGCADISIGDNVPLPPIPKTKPGSRTSTESPIDSTEPSYVGDTGSYWLINFVIAGTCLMVVLAAMALLYAYYYHASRAKRWLKARSLLSSEKPPVAPPRHKRHSMTNFQLQI